MPTSLKLKVLTKSKERWLFSLTFLKETRLGMSEIEVEAAVIQSTLSESSKNSYVGESNPVY